jgi:hypothetical protein
LARFSRRVEAKADRDLIKGFKSSLSSVIGSSASQTFIINENVSEDHFDPEEISKALTRVFGSSEAGLSVVQKRLVQELSESLRSSQMERGYDFVPSMSTIAAEYRARLAIKYGLTGLAAAFVSSLCCLGPFALLLMGVASTTAALSLEQMLFASYHVVFVLSGLGLVAGVVILQLRADGQCNLTGLRRHLGYILVPATSLLVAYAALNYIIGVYFLGGPNPSMLVP